MSELLQFRKYPVGQHPDADQLSAFVEEALPEHERLETLAHLADCADCREIVSLSLPPLEDAAAEEPIPKPVTPPHNGWFVGLFSNWNLVWIATPALAGIVALTVYLRNLPAGSQRAAAPGQLADSHPPAHSAPPPLTAKPDASKTPRTPKARPPANAAKSHAAAGSSSVAAPPIDGRDVAALKPAPPLVDQSKTATLRTVPAAPPEASKSVGGPMPVPGKMAGVVQGAAAPSAQRPAGTALGFFRTPSRPAPAAPMARMAPAPVASQSASALPLPAAVQNQASVSASGAAPASESAATTVNVQSAQIDMPIAGREVPEAANGLAPPKTAYVPAQASLPSGLAVVSLAANLHQRLALDTRNQLFFSADDGQHWKAVSVPWRAHAITVATVAAAPARAKARVLAVPERYTPGAPAFSEPRYAQGSISSSLSGTVTDASGAAISGATVVATDSHTALTRTVQTDSAGRYVVQELPPGVYRLEARAPGFQRQTQTAALGGSQQTVTNIVLAVGQSTQTVTVEASQTAQLQTFSRAMSLGAMKAKKPAAPSTPPAANKLPPVFVITTDTGDRWTSPDGQSWKPE